MDHFRAWRSLLRCNLIATFLLISSHNACIAWGRPIWFLYLQRDPYTRKYIYRRTISIHSYINIIFLNWGHIFYGKTLGIWILKYQLSTEPLSWSRGLRIKHKVWKSFSWAINGKVWNYRDGGREIAMETSPHAKKYMAFCISRIDDWEINQLAMLKLGLGSSLTFPLRVFILTSPMNFLMYQESRTIWSGSTLTRPQLL